MARSYSTACLGGLCAAVGVFLAAVIHRSPEELHVPAWIAYCASGAFVLGGLNVMARAFGLQTSARVLAVATMSALVVTASYLALATGPPWRGAFGLGALAGAVILLWLLFRQLRGQDLPSHALKEETESHGDFRH